jgi:hypothetical protein
MSSERRQALCLLMQDREGRDVGGLILLDQGHRRLNCDWFGTCTNKAVAAVVPKEKRAAPQLACGTHLPNMFLSIWRTANPPRLLVRDGSRLLARNDQVRS